MQKPNIANPVGTTVPATKALIKLPASNGRVLRALISTSEWIRREEIDRIAEASNGPEVISQIRKRLGKDAVETIRFHKINSDGLVVHPGAYRLTALGRQRVSESGILDA